MSFRGSIVFITGASAGIGAATALAFAAKGAKLLLAARRAGNPRLSCTRQAKYASVSPIKVWCGWSPTRNPIPMPSALCTQRAGSSRIRTQRSIGDNMVHILKAGWTLLTTARSTGSNADFASVPAEHR